MVPVLRQEKGDSASSDAIRAPGFLDTSVEPPTLRFPTRFLGEETEAQPRQGARQGW